MVPVVNDRTKLVNVKLKDRKLYNEITNKLFYGLDDEIATIYNDLIVPNQKIVSTMKDGEGRCILHHACYIKHGFEHILRQLIETFPYLVSLPDNQGANLLLLSIPCRHSESTILLMLKLCPKALEVCDNNGTYPLHSAIIFQSETVILKMIKLFPNAVALPNEYGYSALNGAITYKRSEKIILKMIEMCSNAIKIPTRVGVCPLRCAIQYKQSETVVLKMIEVLVQDAVRILPIEKYTLVYGAMKYDQSEIVILKLLELLQQHIEEMNHEHSEILLNTAKEYYTTNLKKYKRSPSKPVLMKLNQLISKKRMRNK